MKRIRTAEDRQAADTRVFESDYFLPQEFVDRFAGEVSSRSNKGPAIGDQDSDDEGTDNETDDMPTEGDPTDGALPAEQSSAEQILHDKAMATCVKNWKSAGDDDSKRMWAIFDESGVFMSACRHGLIMWIIDMIRSGEL